MYLRAIVINGFKTFARRTEIRFDGGMVGIVGPNGSGKTNIVDAFKWVLGESHVKDLRGKRMDEVIYAGGERTPRSSFADVSLLLDNSERRLPVDYEEVEIRRRVERGGDTEYFLNGTRVRRRDIQQLLASTGLTIDSYALINQSDIESIVTRSPEQRRQLIEEAAQVRGVKQQRSEAAARMSDLAQNLLRLEDLRQELGPRLDILREQAVTAADADVARERLEVLRGSLLWEEWREARDAHRRAQSQQQTLERRLEEARAQAATAELAFQDGRAATESAQDRRLARQKAIGALRLEVSHARHQVEIANERVRGLDAAMETAGAELDELNSRSVVVATARVELESAEAAAQAALAGIAADTPAPTAIDPAEARRAQSRAEEARRTASTAASNLAAARTRNQYLEESVARLEAAVLPAEEQLPTTESEAQAAVQAARAAAVDAAEVVRIRAELEGLQALWPAPRPGRLRVADVLNPEPGYEAALSAVLGSLVDAWAVADAEAASVVLGDAESQQTVLLPGGSPSRRSGHSLADHVRAEPGFEWLAARLLGHVSVDGELPCVSSDGLYREAGLRRSGPDQRVKLAARRRRLGERLHVIEKFAEEAPELAARARQAETRLSALTAAAAGRGRLDETLSQLDTARHAEAALAEQVPQFEAAAEAAANVAAASARALAGEERILAAHAAEQRRLEVERLRWRERVNDQQRQLNHLDGEINGLTRGRQARTARLEELAAALESSRHTRPELAAVLEQAEGRLLAAELESPEEEAELGEVARRLVALEEARVDARLRVRTLEGNLELVVREAQIAALKMEELRTKMPMGQAPEEIPGGRAREQEMRRLERRLDEIGPTNPLAASELAELDQRCSTLERQLEDIVSARRDLEELVGRLREEEDRRYDAVFGAVAAGFQEYFGELTAGGTATLTHVAGDDGPRSGVEILVRPPRKKLQNITLLSSGERSLTALALVLALEEVNPSPFMILDEVDAALDDANVARCGALLQRLGQTRQLLVITHNHVTMASANSLYGVHLDESGRSSLVSVRLDDIRPRARRAATA